MTYVNEMYYYITIEYPESMELIDESINKYYRLANMRIRLVTSNGLNLQSSIDAVLTKIKESEQNEKNEITGKLHECLSIGSQKYISRKSYHKKKRKVNEVESTAIVSEDLSDEEKAKITSELLNSSVNPYSIEKTNGYFDNLFKKSMHPFVKSKHIKTKEDALMFASALIYSDEDSFGYVVDLDEGYEKTSVADIANMTIRRKR